MIRIRSSRGFTMQLILMLVLVVAAVGLSGWYLMRDHKQRLDNDNTSAEDFVPGYISVTFRDGVTFQQASSLIKSYGLAVDKPGDYDEAFTPHSYRAINAGQFNVIEIKLRNYPEVASFIDDSSDPSNNRAGPGEKWVKVTYKQETTC